jgi:hypothetical protein
MSNIGRKIERNHLRKLVGNKNVKTYYGQDYTDQQILRAEQRKKEQIKKRKEKEEKSKLQSE